MRTPTTLVAAGALIAVSLSTVAAAPATQRHDQVDHEVVLMLGESATVDGGEVAGVNLGHLAGTDDTYPCGSDPSALCASVLVEVTNPYEEENARKGRERANLGLVLSGSGAGDAAIMVYESDEDGSHGSMIGSSDELGSLADEATTVVVTTTEDVQTTHVLVEVFFHAWVGTWSLDLSFDA